MIVECDTCAIRGDACGDCMVTVLLQAPEPRGSRVAGSPGRGGVTSSTVTGELPPGAYPARFDAPERRALDTLAAAGLVPPLRLVSGRPRSPRLDADVSPGCRHAG